MTDETEKVKLKDVVPSDESGMWEECSEMTIDELTEYASELADAVKTYTIAHNIINGYKQKVAIEERRRKY